MASFLRSYEPQVYALLRIMTGFLFLWHGTQKLFAVPVPPPPVPPFVIAIAGPIELVGGLLVMIGLFAGWAAFLCSGLMAFAFGWYMVRKRFCRSKTAGSWPPSSACVSVYFDAWLRHLERGCGSSRLTFRVVPIDWTFPARCGRLA